MAKKKNDRQKFADGYFGGFSAYRYGEVTKPVSLAKQKPLLPHDERKRITDRIFALAAEWRSTPFENEGSLRHGIRQTLCLQGYSWRKSDMEAAVIVDEAIRRQGVERPRPDEGQPDYTYGSDYCSWCHGPIDEEDYARKRRFCSVECARSVMLHRQRQEGEHFETVLRSAQRIVARASAPARQCKHCTASFHSDDKGQVFCSYGCAWHAQIRLAAITCESCGRIAKPHRRGAKFCSLSCSATVQIANERRRLAAVIRQCACCEGDFTPTRDFQKHCSARCAQKMSQKAFHDRKRAARFGSPLAIAFAPPEIETLTATVFDFMLRRRGARVTALMCEAA